MSLKPHTTFLLFQTGFFSVGTLGLCSLGKPAEAQAHYPALASGHFLMFFFCCWQESVPRGPGAGREACHLPHSGMAAAACAGAAEEGLPGQVPAEDRCTCRHHAGRGGQRHLHAGRAPRTREK